MSQLIAEMPFELPYGQQMRSTIAGSNEIGHGFGLTQIHLSVKISTLRIFSRLCLSTTTVDKQLQYFSQDILAAVTTDFRAIFASIGMRSTENRDQYFVDDIACRVYNLTIMNGIGFGRT